MREKKVLAWHFVNDNRMLGHDAKELVVEPGYIYSVDKDTEPILCKQGLHGSLTVLDALQYAQGSYLCRVAMWGDMRYGNDKVVARYREVLAAKDVSSELRLWGCWCVRQIWHLLPDELCREAVAMAEAYAIGKATATELEAARGAAWAAWDATWDASWAAWATARTAAWAARTTARAAAWDAARGAAWAAARAAGGAARTAAGDAARDAAWAAQKTELERRMLALLGV